MKFGRDFREALEKEGFPDDWIDTAIPYRQLKKLLKKIQVELESLGLDQATLAQLHRSNSDEADRNAEGVAFQYKLKVMTTFVPKLSFFIDVDNGVEDVQLSPETRRFFQTYAMTRQADPNVSSSRDDIQSEHPAVEVSTLTEPANNLRRIDIHLRFDAEFFGLLQGDVSGLDSLQAQQKDMLANEIQELSKTLAVVARPSPSALHKSDLNRWRELFVIYLEAGVFFSTNELDHGSRTSFQAAQQLQWFQDEVTKRDIMSKFKVKGSHAALRQFVEINVRVLQNLKFQDLQNTAVHKIMKKFDKRTSLGAARTFPKLILSSTVIGESMAKDVCAQITQDLVQVVPQVEDFACPCCTDIVWRPVRLLCKHLICIDCAIKMQKGWLRFCPLCRGDVVMVADTDNIDRDLEEYLRKYFPKEINVKQILNETNDGIARFGPDYRHPSEYGCTIM